MSCGYVAAEPERRGLHEDFWAPPSQLGAGWPAGPSSPGWLVVILALIPQLLPQSSLSQLLPRPHQTSS